MCTTATISTAKCFNLLLAVNSSSLAKRPVPATRTRIHYAFPGRATDPNLINSWVAGALDSAWRAVNQYLLLHHPGSIRQKFLKLWGETEYWDEASNKELVELNHRLTERHLVIGLYKSGVKFDQK